MKNKVIYHNSRSLARKRFTHLISDETLKKHFYNVFFIFFFLTIKYNLNTKKVTIKLFKKTIITL